MKNWMFYFKISLWLWRNRLLQFHWNHESWHLWHSAINARKFLLFLTSSGSATPPRWSLRSSIRNTQKVRNKRQERLLWSPVKCSRRGSRRSLCTASLLKATGILESRAIRMLTEHEKVESSENDKTESDDFCDGEPVLDDGGQTDRDTVDGGH